MIKYFKLKCIFILFALHVAYASDALHRGNSEVLHRENSEVLHRGNKVEPSTLDPHFVSSVWEDNIVGDMFMGLTDVSAQGAVIAGLASDWKISNDGKVYTFTIRKNAKWSDGKPITAYDVRYSFKRLLNPKTKAKNTYILYAIKNAKSVHLGKKTMDTLGIRVRNTYTIQIILEKNTPSFLEKLKHSSAYIVPKHSIKKYGKNWTKQRNIVVSGAFKLGEWKKNHFLTLAKNPKFFDAKNVQLNKVIYYPIEDSRVELDRYIDKTLDITSSIPSAFYKFIKRRYKGQVYTAPYLSIYYYPINTKRIKDIGMRKAMSLAINRTFITNFTLQAGQRPAYNFVPNTINQYKSKQLYPKLYFSHKLYSSNLFEAKKIMRKAGYNNKNRFPLTLSYNGDIMNEKIAKIIASMWKRIYIDVTFKILTKKKHYDNLKKGNFDVGNVLFIGTYDNSLAFMNEWLDTVYNVPENMHDTLMPIVKKANKTHDLKERIDLLKKIEQILLDSYSIIPIFYPMSQHLVSQKVKGWKNNILDIHRSRWIRKK